MAVVRSWLKDDESRRRGNCQQRAIEADHHLPSARKRRGTGHGVRNRDLTGLEEGHDIQDFHSRAEGSVASDAIWMDRRALRAGTSVDGAKLIQVAIEHQSAGYSRNRVPLKPTPTSVADMFLAVLNALPWARYTWRAPELTTMNDV